MSHPLRAAVVGAGRIGAREDAQRTDLPLTHAGGYLTAGFALAAIVDTDQDARGLAERRWACAAYADFDEMMRKEAPDVVSFAVPTSVRAELLRRALAYRPRAVVAEKPLTASLTESQEIDAAYRHAGIALIVNYTRRFVPFWQTLRGATAMSTTIRYAKGLRHNGTHAIDLCRMLFGECLSAIRLSSKDDFWVDDPTVSAFLRFERCPEVCFQGLDERCFTLFEVDIIRETSRLIVDRDGRRARRFDLRRGVGIPPGSRLVEAGEEDTGAAAAMVNLMHHARDVLAGSAPLCGGQDAVAAQRVAEQLAT